MRKQVTLALLCMLYPKVLTLKCYQCTPGLSGTCTDTQTYCPDQCASMTTIMNAGGQQHRMNWKTCAAAEQCFTGSLNLGLVKISINAKCCSTDLCNSQPAPVLPEPSLNGKKCYTCTEEGCSYIVNCKGDEDHCISTIAAAGGVQRIMKGCASRTFCAAPVSHMQADGMAVNVHCCEGDLCNGMEGVKLCILVFLGHLLSFILLLCIL